MGNRFACGIVRGVMPIMNRYVGNPILSGIGRLFFRCPAADFHCRIRRFAKTAFEQMDLRTGMKYASEMVIKAPLEDMKICEVPTTLSPDCRSRERYLWPWRDGWRYLRFMLLLQPTVAVSQPGHDPDGDRAGPRCATAYLVGSHRRSGAWNPYAYLFARGC